MKIEGMKLADGSEFANTLQFSALEKRFVFTNEIPQFRGKLAAMLSDEQRSKIINGEIVQVVGMTDKAGKKYNAYVRWNPDEKRLNFSPNPNFTRKTGKATPMNEYKTQVAANSDGHKPKALESVQGPVEQKQPNTPTAAQKAEQQARRGMKM